MTSRTATLRRHDAPPGDLPEARPPAARPGPTRPGRLAGALRLVVTDPARPQAASAPLPHREAVRVTACGAALDVAGAGARRGTGRLLSRQAPAGALGLLARRALATPGPAAPDARPQAQASAPMSAPAPDLIHPGRAFCDGAWTPRRRPARLVRVAGRGPLPDGLRSVTLRRRGDVILLTPRTRRGAVADLARLGLLAAGPDEALGAAIRQVLGLR